ncbi:hypothetical protein, partial [Bartonella grahamii]|uniref:hypothetical protein n=1 Tax=Bartonella grahamii TaxID=33045 RepID=UPI001ABB9923
CCRWMHYDGLIAFSRMLRAKLGNEKGHKKAAKTKEKKNLCIHCALKVSNKMNHIVSVTEKIGNRVTIF